MLLEVKNLNVFYDEIQALWDVSFNVEKGETVCIIGPNGAGKTTLLNTIMGFLSPKQGTIKFNGKEISKMPIHKRVEMGIALAPEGRHLFPYMTVYQNLVMGAFTPRARKKLKENLEMVYEMFPILKERKDQKAGTLSGGEQQMLVLGRGLMSSPELFMLDEPSSGLAPKIVATVLETVKKLNEEYGLTILLVEQNVHVALEISHRGYVIENGRIVLAGEAKELLYNEHVKRAYLGI